MITERTKVFHYKKAQPNLSGKLPPLQDLLTKALKQREVVMDRARQLSKDDPTHLINYKGTHGRSGAAGNIFGIEFLSFVAGQDPSALTIDPKAKELAMEQINLSAQGKETVEGSVYCGVRGNHVVIAQSSALRVLQLERYINWLLIQTKLLDDKNYIGLLDFVPPKKARAFKDIREVQLTAPVGFDRIIPVDDQDHQIAVDDVRSIEIRPRGNSWRALKEFIGDAFDLPDTLSAAQVIEKKALEVTLKLKWLRARDEDPSDLLNNVASNLRHFDDEVDYKIISKAGTEITRDEIKQRSKPQKIKWQNGRPMWDDIFSRMISYLDGLAEKGTIKK